MSIIGFVRRGLVAAIGVVALAIVAPALVAAQSGQYSTSISGASEVPANSSTATGTFTATLNEAAQTLTWSLSVPSITSVTMAHIHSGARGVNGPVIVTLFMPTAPAGSVSTSGTAGPADLAGPFAGNWAGFVEALKSGGLYINVHTTAIPAGEIRGQVGVGAPSQSTPSGIGTPRPASSATPAVPKTGQAGLFDEAANPDVAMVLVALAVVLVAGVRLLTPRLR